METCLSQRPTDEESPESRMREIRLSGLMRGGEIESETDNSGQFNSHVISLPTLPITFMTKQRSFASLTEEEINQVAEWLQHGTYDEVRDRIAKPRPEGFGIKVSRTPLQRLWAKTARVERINGRIASGQRLTLNEFDAINAGEKTDLAEEIHQAILEDTHALATSGENTHTQLLALPFCASVSLSHNSENPQTTNHQ